MANEPKVYFYYRIRHPDDGAIVSATSLRAIQAFLHDKSEWPSGTYEILESGTVNPHPGEPAPLWGIAVKAPDGTVELVRGQPA